MRRRSAIEGRLGVEGNATVVQLVWATQLFRNAHIYTHKNVDSKLKSEREKLQVAERWRRGRRGGDVDRRVGEAYEPWFSRRGD